MRPVRYALAIFAAVFTVAGAQAAPLPEPSSEVLVGHAPINPVRQSVPRVVEAVSPPGSSFQLVTLGSAVVVGDQIAVTDYHVVAEGGRLYLAFLNGALLPVRPVVLEPGSDFAVLRAESKLPVQPVVLAGNGVARTGDRQTVIGYRQDLAEQPSVKQGRITGFTYPGVQGPGGRSWPLILSDTPASFGDSGGAALDDAGRLAGLVRGGLSVPGKTEVVSSPAGMIETFLARGWLMPASGRGNRPTAASGTVGTTSLLIRAFGALLPK